MTLLLSSTVLGSPVWAQTGGQPGPTPLPSTVPANQTQADTSPATPASAPATLGASDQSASSSSGDVGVPPGPGAGAQAPEAPPSGAPAITPAELARQTGVVNRIVVQGNERIETGTILSYLPLGIGDSVDAAKLDVAIKTLSRTDLFSDVKIDLNTAIGELTVRVVENPIINQVVFEGNSALSTDKLKDEVTVHPRGIFTRSRVAQDVQRIVELYRRSGRIGAAVTPKIVELPQRRVDLVFEIAEGPKTGIARINILGNKAFSDNALRDVVVTKESHWYRFFSSNDNYDPDRIEYDREQLRKHYTNRGYYDFRTISSVAELEPDQGSFALTYTIDEGSKYKFGKLKVVTDVKKLNGDLLRALLPIREGQTYQSDRIEQAVDALTFAAGAAGFAFVDIRPRYSANRDSHTVDVTFEVKEGARVYVERIDIVGNTVTLDSVIRRELRISEGDAYNQVLVDRSKTEVKRLDFFKTVDVDKLPGSAPDRAVLRVKVQEQPTGQLSFGAGYSSVDQLLLDVGISQSNLGGRGQDLRLRAAVGSLRQTIDLGFTEPRFLGRDLRGGFDLYSYRYDFSSQAGYNSESTGGNLRLSFPINANTLFSARYSLHTDRVVVNDSFCTPGAALISTTLCDQRGARLTSSIGYSLYRDTRNDPRRATRGYYLSLNQDFAGVGGDVNYLKTEASGAIYHGFTADIVGRFQVQTGYVLPFAGDVVRINDRFFKGGNTFRGFKTAGIGPRDTSFDEALGGKAYAIGTLELSFPNFLPEQYGIRTAAFTDFGTLGLLDDKSKIIGGVASTTIQDELALRASAGLSVFWTSPLGPIRLDFSQVLAKQPYDKTEAFRFSTSTAF